MVKQVIKNSHLRFTERIFYEKKRTNYQHENGNNRCKAKNGEQVFV